MLRRIKGRERREDKTTARAPPEIPPVASSPAPPLWAAGAALSRSRARSEASPARLCVSSRTHRCAAGRRSVSVGQAQHMLSSKAACRSLPGPALLSAWPAAAAATPSPRSLALRGEGGADHLSWGSFQTSTVRRGSGLHRYLPRDGPLGPPRARQPTRCPPGLRRCTGLSASTGSSSDGVGVGSPPPPPTRLGTCRGRAEAHPRRVLRLEVSTVHPSYRSSWTRSPLLRFFVCRRRWAGPEGPGPIHRPRATKADVVLTSLAGSLWKGPESRSTTSSPEIRRDVTSRGDSNDIRSARGAPIRARSLARTDVPQWTWFSLGDLAGDLAARRWDTRLSGARGDIHSLWCGGGRCAPGNLCCDTLIAAGDGCTP